MTTPPAISPFNLADLWEAVADEVPARVALRCSGAERTFAQLEERANRLAHWLIDRGVQPGQHVGLYLQNCPEYVEAMLAAYKVRAVPINVNFRYVAEELRYLFNDADLVGVLYQPEYADRLAEVTTDTPRLGWSLATGPEYEDALAASSPQRDFGRARGMTTTSSIPGAPRGCRRGCSGARRTRSSPAWEAATRAGRRSPRSASWSSASRRSRPRS